MPRRFRHLLVTAGLAVAHSATAEAFKNDTDLGAILWALFFVGFGVALLFAGLAYAMLYLYEPDCRYQFKQMVAVATASWWLGLMVLSHVNWAVIVLFNLAVTAYTGWSSRQCVEEYTPDATTEENSA